MSTTQPEPEERPIATKGGSLFANCPVVMTAPIEDWCEWLNQLSNTDLPKVHRAIACIPPGHSQTYRAKLNDIADFVKDIMASRFASLVAERDFAVIELGKAKEVIRRETTMRLKPERRFFGSQREFDETATTK